MTQTMFERYGGFAVLSKLVMSLYDKILDSDVAGPYFDDVDMRVLIDHQTKFISQLMGGPAAYTDPMLEQLHAHLGVTDAAFDEVIDLLRDTLEDFELEPADVDHIVGEMEARRPVIVIPLDPGP
ncbi:MAG: group I truncated hemoglobin [Planctomycetota bacterium]|jgi:hemoglobin